MKTTLDDAHGSSAGKSPRPEAVHVLIQGDQGLPTACTTFLSLRGLIPERWRRRGQLSTCSYLQARRLSPCLLSSPSSRSLSLPSMYPTDAPVPAQFSISLSRML